MNYRFARLSGVEASLGTPLDPSPVDKPLKVPLDLRHSFRQGDVRTGRYRVVGRSFPQYEEGVSRKRSRLTRLIITDALGLSAEGV